MMDNKFDYEVTVDDEDELIEVFRNIPERNIAFAFTGRPYPFMVHVLRNNGRATVREMDYEVVPVSATGRD